MYFVLEVIYSEFFLWRGNLEDYSAFGRLQKFLGVEIRNRNRDILDAS